MIHNCKKIYLCTPDLKKITVLNGVKTSTVNYNKHVKDYDVLTFDVDRFINIEGVLIESNGYSLLDIYTYLYLEDEGHFQMQHPTLSNDGEKEIKSIVAYSIEKEFEDKSWVGFKVNTGETDSLEQLAENNLNNLGFAKEFVTFYKSNDSTQKDLSLIHLILTKMPGWSVLDDDIDPLLWNVKLSINEENINLYALLTSIIAPKAECIFLFDTINKRIKAVSKHSLEYDTNIFIGLHNLAQNIEITVNEDSVFTMMNCEGSEGLGISNVFYKDSSIIDLSYFMRWPFMSDELIAKVQTWTDWRNSHIEDFMELSKEYANLNDQIYDLKYRVPNDGDDWSQWDSMEEEMLYQNLDYYNALLTSFQVSVDENPQYDDEGNYIPISLADGSVDHDYYLEKLYDAENGYGGYYTYLEIRDYIIPNIEIAINNLGVIEDEKYDYITEYETNWELYGIEELKSKQKDYENRLSTLEKYSKPWKDLTEEKRLEYPGGEEEYNIAGRSEYEKYKNYLGNENTEGTLLFQLNILEAELELKQTSLKNIEIQRNNMHEQAQMSYPEYGFTDEEIVLVTTLLHETDYVNENILATSVDTAVTKVDKEKELFDDSVSKLSEISRPQYSFNVALDNLLRIKEFQTWNDDLKLLYYIRLGIRDDYNVKLRVVGITWNPCEITSDLTLEFSSMITSRSGRSDLTDLLNSENNRAAQNTISVGTGNASTDKELATEILELLTKYSALSNTIKNVASNTTGQIDDAEINNLISQYMRIAKIDVSSITGTEGNFEKFFTTYLNSEYIVANLLNADTILTDDIKAVTGEFTNYLTSVRIIGDLIEARTIVADKIILRGSDQSLVYALNNEQITFDENGNVLTGVDGTAIQNFVTDESGDYVLDSNGNKIPTEEIQQYQLNGKILVAESVTAKEINVHDLWVTGIATMLNANIGTAQINNLYAVSAKLANWHIANDKLWNGYIDVEGNGLSEEEVILGLAGNGNVYLGDAGISFSDKLIYDASTGNLSIKGHIEATSGTFTGEVNAESGAIANWNIYNNYFNSVYENTSSDLQYWIDHKICLSSILYDDTVGELAEDIKTSSEVNSGYWEGDTWIEEEYVPVAGAGNKYAQPVIAVYSKYYTSSQKVNHYFYETYRHFVLYGDGRLILQDDNFEFRDGKFIAKGHSSTNGYSSTFEIEDAIIYGKHNGTVDSLIDLSAYYVDGHMLVLKNETGIYIQSQKILFHSTNNTESQIDITGSLAASNLIQGYTGQFTNLNCSGSVTANDITVTTSAKGDTLSFGTGFIDKGIFGASSFSGEVLFSSNIVCEGTISGLLIHRGNNTITGTTNDTVSNWVNQKISFHYYNASGTLIDKPASYGYLMTIGATSNVHQLWFTQPNGNMAHRGGNTNGWSGTWRTILDSTNYTSYTHDRLVSGSFGVEVITLGGTNFFAPGLDTTYYDGTVNLGGTVARWKNIYATNATIYTSDANEKHAVEDINDVYEQFFMKLRPVTYMWNKHSESDTQVHDRIHCGIIAQEANEAAESVGLSSSTVAAICRDDLDIPTEDGRTERWGIAYTELHGLEIHMIQKTIRHQEEQDAKILLLEEQLKEKDMIIQTLQDTITDIIYKLNVLEQKG